MYLLTAKEMQDFDQHTIEHVGLPGVVLMENAGRAAFEEIKARFSNAQRVVVLAGPGNNGGDGFVVARYLAQEGWDVVTWMIGKKEKMSEEAKTHYRACEHFITIKHDPTGDNRELQQDLEQASVIVDALLGVGMKGGLRAPFIQVVQTVNKQTQSWVISIDLPSGVETDTGKVHTDAVRADHTITFAYPKWGHLLRPGAEYTGSWKVVDIGIVPNYLPKSMINQPIYWQKSLASRSPWSHKGTYGHLLIIGGTKGMLGAVEMAEQAAFRTGVGKVTLTVPSSQQTACASKVTQSMVWDWPGEECFAEASAALYRQRQQDFSAVTVGTGLGRFSGEEKWLKTLLAEIKVPLVLDADALNILADHPQLLNARKQTSITICTPHPGELARLLACSIEEVEKNRSTVAQDYATKTGTVVVLKGRYSIIAFPNGKQVVNLTGSPSLAKAGSGDLLTGMIGSFLAQGMDLEKAVPAAVYIHGKAGEQAVSSSAHSVTYAEIVAELGSVLHQLTSKPTYFLGN